MKTRKILLTGGAGDLGRMLSPTLIAKGYAVASIDPRLTDIEGVTEVAGSIMNPESLATAVSGSDLVVHIAAWHGYHEFTGAKSVEEFWDLNVTGTFKLLEACVQHKVGKLVFISSTSVDEWPGVYGTTKLLAEELCRAYASRHAMQILVVRPRAFIPWWNTVVYQSFKSWAEWFARGAVHIDDVRDGVVQGCERLFATSDSFFEVCEFDGKHTFDEAELASWAHEGGERFLSARFPEFVPTMKRFDFFPARPPSYKGLEKARALIGYEPRYGFNELLIDLAEHGQP